MLTSSVEGMIAVCVGHISKQVSVLATSFASAQCFSLAYSYLKVFEDTCSISDHILMGQHGAFGVSCKVQSLVHQLV